MVIKNDDPNKNSELLKENPERFCVFPIRHNDIWGFYKDAVACFWTAEEIDFEADINDWKELNKDERYFIKHILAFFANADGIVNENLILNFYDEVQLPEARSFYAFQVAIESVHSEVYSLMIDTLVKDKDEKANLFNAIDTIPSIKKKADWAIRWITNGSFAERLVSFAVVEGVFFSGAFCSIYWLKSQGKMVGGLSLSNEFISRDEGMHMEFACLLYSKLDVKLSESRIYEIIREAVLYEQEFITDSLPVSLLGMNCELMKEYIEFVADRLVLSLGYNKIFNASNPFGFMEMISLDKKTNFFESRNSQYARANIKSTPEERRFNLDDDF